MDRKPRSAGALRVARPLPAILLGGLGASLVSVFILGKLSEEILEHEAFTLDTEVIGLARRMRSPLADRVFSTITASGEPWAMGPIGAALAGRWLREDRPADTIVFALALVGGGIVNQLLKTFFRRPRPPLELRRAHASSYSFPSGHAMTTLTTYSTWAYLVSRHAALTGQQRVVWIWAPVLAGCVLVGWSRIYLEVHYPTDVLGGWAAGTIWLTTCAIARSFMEPEEA